MTPSGQDPDEGAGTATVATNRPHWGDISESLNAERAQAGDRQGERPPPGYRIPPLLKRKRPQVVSARGVPQRQAR